MSLECTYRMSRGFIILFWNCSTVGFFFIPVIWTYALKRKKNFENKLGFTSSTLVFIIFKPVRYLTHGVPIIRFWIGDLDFREQNRILLSSSINRIDFAVCIKCNTCCTKKGKSRPKKPVAKTSTSYISVRFDGNSILSYTYIL